MLRPLWGFPPLPATCEGVYKPVQEGLPRPLLAAPCPSLEPIHPGASRGLIVSTVLAWDRVQTLFAL